MKKSLTIFKSLDTLFLQTISQLTLQIDKYKLRIEVMMQNLAACGKTLSDIGQEKKIIGEIKKKNLELQEEVKRMSKTSVEKDKRIKALTENLKSLEKSKGGAEEVEIIRGQMSEMQKEITEAKRKMGMRQKERDEMADKLLKSVKLIMEERSARQAAEMVVAEKEKNLKEKLEDAKVDLTPILSSFFFFFSFSFLLFFFLFSLTSCF